ncbi:MMPL family transporter [Actinomadura sp. 9N407]|uniref:MMPL family transporter n=1 Tax=Actinomadura sp. 9N407 TaxID=3375154 RepID=UPI003787DA05
MNHTISGFSVRRPWVVIVLWLAVVAAGFGVGTGVFDKLNPEVGSVPGSESYRAEQRLEQAAPRPETITAIVPGRPANDPALKGSLAAVRAVPGVAEVSEPLPSSQAGGPLLVEIALAPGDGQEDAAETAAGRLEGLGATVSGGPLSDAEYDEQAQSDVARAEMLSMPVVLVLLLVFFGGLLAAGLPLLIAVVGVGATFGILYAFSTVTDISVYSIQIVTMLAVGLAVDYALLIVSRFREERHTAPDVHTAVTRTMATAGRTVMFSGLTVAVALAGLTVFPDPFLRSMGVAGAAVVAVDMAVALTLLPALLGRFGHRIKPAKRREGRAVFARVARAVQRRPVLTLVVAAGAMVTLALPVFGMRISEGDPRMLPESSTTRAMWDQLNRYFPEQAQWGGDIQIIADAPADDPRIASLRRDVAALPGVAEVRMEKAGPEATAMMATPRGAAESAEARAAVESIRDLRAPFGVEVTGDTARLADYKAMLVERVPWAIAIVAFGTLLLLFAFTGSVLLPVKAVLTNLLSIGAALGVVVWVFQDGHLAGLFGTEGAGYLHLTVPVLVGAIAFGLSVDYEVFLLSRIRERWLAGAGPRASVAEGLQHTGGIVTAAALVIGVVFAAFALGGFAPIKALGLGLALAVTLDATIVRMLLVPATMTLLGRYNWWLPRPLHRVHTRLALTESVREDTTPEPVSEPVHAGR